IIGIGGTGGKVLKEFLKNEDISILGRSLGEHIAFGSIKGIWMDFDTSDCLKEKFYGGRLEEGHYPGFIVPPEVIKNNSKVKEYILNEYGYDLRKQGFDRRAETMKAIFEIFQADPTVRSYSIDEYSGSESPLLSYLWEQAISRFVTIGRVAGENGANPGENLRTKGDMEPGEEANNAPVDKPAAHSPEEEHNNHQEIKKILGNGRAILSKLGAHQRGNAENVCESILFIASLGGGTGTGFINPLTSFIRTRGSLAALALCLFTEKGIDTKATIEEQRDLGAIIAMYDLLTKRRGNGIDGLILIDNQILQSKFGGRNYSAMNRAVFDAMRPLVDQRRFPDIDDESLGLQRVFLEGLNCPGILVPCHAHIDSAHPSEKELIDRALKEGKLFPCDSTKADEAYIFSRGLQDPSLLQKELQKAIGQIDGKEKTVHVYPKIGDNSSAEILILLRNPYGNGEKLGYSRNTCKHQCKNESEWKKTLCKTFEQRIYCATCMAQRYLEDYESEIITAGMTPVNKAALGSYFYGSKWIDKSLKLLEEKEDLSEGDKKFRERLMDAKEQHSKANMPFLMDELDKALGRLERGEKPIFRRELNIFAGNMAKPEEVLFCWEKVPGEHSQKIQEYLAQSFGVDWIKSGDLRKIDNDMTIEVLAANNCLSLKLNEFNDKVILEIDGNIAYDFAVKKENGELKILAGSPDRNGMVKADIKSLKPLIQSEIRNILTKEYGWSSSGK
ncbi:MAG: hypothetical protein M0Q43_08130, partial [Methanothrix sp.]|nr:hypothetical protein [Methanothrix sp.]